MPGIDVGGGALERQSICVEAVHIEIQTVIMQKIKHDILSVSKPVARYQKYVHIKAYLAKRYYISLGAGSEDIHTCTWEGQLH